MNSAGTHRLHFTNELVHCAHLRYKFSPMPNWHRLQDRRAGIRKRHLPASLQAPISVHLWYVSSAGHAHHNVKVKEDRDVPLN
jgi:hypothetical protein